MTVREHTQETQSLELRRATATDRDALIAMYLRFEPKGAYLGLPPRKDPGHWLDQLRSFRNFLVMVDGKVVGHAVLCPEGDSGEVAVFVQQGHRHRGLGRMLLSEIIDEARRLRLRRVWCLTELDNRPMRRLARSLGFATGDNPYEMYLDPKKQTRIPDVGALAA
jgi:RimJ/RimL family protein N-acetyltransferase